MDIRADLNRLERKQREKNLRMESHVETAGENCLEYKLRWSGQFEWGGEMKTKPRQLLFEVRSLQQNMKNILKNQRTALAEESF